MQLELADLSLDERRDAARWHIRELLEFPVEQAVVDVFDVAPFGSDNKPLAYVVSARESQLRDRVEQLQEAELLPVAIDIPEFALRNLADLFTDDDLGTAILLLQEQEGMLMIARDGVQYLTRKLTSGMEDLIPHADGDYEALTEQLDSIVLEVQRSFDYCESTFRLPMVSRLLVAQTDREITAVTTYLNDYLSTRVEPFSFDNVLTVPEGSEQLELNRHLLAIGGALRQENS
jgi:MSHA biogenesis protein MshI